MWRGGGEHDGKKRGPRLGCGRTRGDQHGRDRGGGCGGLENLPQRLEAAGGSFTSSSKACGASRNDVAAGQWAAGIRRHEGGKGQAVANHSGVRPDSHQRAPEGNGEVLPRPDKNGGRREQVDSAGRHERPPADGGDRHNRSTRPEQQPAPEPEHASTCCFPSGKCSTLQRVVFSARPPPLRNVEKPRHGEAIRNDRVAADRPRLLLKLDARLRAGHEGGSRSLGYFSRTGPPAAGEPSPGRRLRLVRKEAEKGHSEKVPRTSTTSSGGPREKREIQREGDEADRIREDAAGSSNAGGERSVGGRKAREAVDLGRVPRTLGREAAGDNRRRGAKGAEDFEGDEAHGAAGPSKIRRRNLPGGRRPLREKGPRAGDPGCGQVRREEGGEENEKHPATTNARERDRIFGRGTGRNASEVLRGGLRRGGAGVIPGPTNRGTGAQDGGGRERGRGGDG
mmetsp:Transcript_24955/g.62764  ORF Transcript_24955/g.62764 Transcript_24955/m.62764 type:complete len:453 (+) Transcript_24955:430-1788(+)